MGPCISKGAFLSRSFTLESSSRVDSTAPEDLTSSVLLEASVFANTILEVPYDNYSLMGPKTLF